MPPGNKKQKIGYIIGKVYDFQFYENFEEVKEYSEMLKKKIDNYQNVTEEEIQRLKEMLSNGFHNWSL